ncbi:MAG: acetyl-CoA carboxylase, biotin carboxyl carrier protein [Prochlorococcus sp. SP3034]|nr:acetyl-CoA carboxylase, biotin carboxyl carrier protein [Prochlorococcus sp. SP3034]|tara:strand:- start:4037 stop:4540 length:504 start_codon:yes stop_codon:yes gene_type:complete
MIMKLDHDDLNRLIEKISNSDFQEFSLEGEDFKLEIKRNLSDISHQNQSEARQLQDSQANSSQVIKNENSSTANSTSSAPVPLPGRSGLIEVTSPMVGTFYRASAPGEEPFVEIGSQIRVGQTICILEAMKLMNEIESELNAEIIEILVENGTPVEFGQVLMRVKQT